ncbi:MAG: T9SS type A sorting domain-containing protein [Lewinellaceae bacterium]|nr:T9SS type A sorting domain-containing protein [Lewinellaceae bacterium]
MQTRTKGYAPDATQLAALKDIGTQCPLTCGDAVFRARRLIKLSVPKEYNDNDLCSEERSPKVSKSLLLPHDLRLVPNPASDRIQFWFGNDFTNEALELSIADFSGRILLNTSVNAGSGVVTTDISNLEPGLYYCTLKNAAQAVYQGNSSLYTKPFVP